MIKEFNLSRILGSIIKDALKKSWTKTFDFNFGWDVKISHNKFKIIFHDIYSIVFVIYTQINEAAAWFLNFYFFHIKDGPQRCIYILFHIITPSPGNTF